MQINRTSITTHPVRISLAWLSPKRIKICTFAENNNLLLRKISDSKTTFLLIDEKEVEDIDPKYFRRLFKFYEEIKGTIRDNCYDIAGRAVGQHVASGCLSAEFGTYSFTGFANHCLNYICLPDRTIMAVDFTSGKNIDENKGTFHVLGIRAYDFKSLCSKLDKLYGGYWNVR